MKEELFKNDPFAKDIINNDNNYLNNDFRKHISHSQNVNEQNH